jgi:hypothetical protein
VDRIAELKAHYDRQSPTPTTDVSIIETAVAEMHERVLGRGPDGTE